MTYKHIDSWKNSTDAFNSQLQRNIAELHGAFPPHWDNFLNVIRRTKDLTRVVDIGCGAGSYCFLTRENGLDYIGYDYSEYAVSLAKSTWGGTFVTANYNDITEDHISSGDMIVANALCDVLPNGNECLDYLLSLGADNLLIQRVRITSEDNHFIEYKAYDLMTYEFYHNEDELFSVIENYGYNIETVCLYDNIYDLVIGRNNE